MATSVHKSVIRLPPFGGHCIFFFSLFHFFRANGLPKFPISPDIENQDVSSILLHGPICFSYIDFEASVMAQGMLDDIKKVKDLLHGSLSRCGLPEAHNCDVSFRPDERLLTLILSRPIITNNGAPCVSPSSQDSILRSSPSAVQPQQSPSPPVVFVETILEARIPFKYPVEPPVWKIATPISSSSGATSSRKVYHPSVLQDMSRAMHHDSTTVTPPASHSRERDDGPHTSWEGHNIVVLALRYTMWWFRLAMDDKNIVGGSDVAAAWTSQELQQLRTTAAPLKASPGGASESVAQGHRVGQQHSRSMSGLLLPDGRVVLWNLPDDHPLAISATFRRRRYSCSNVVAAAGPSGARDAPSDHFVPQARRANTVNEINPLTMEGAMAQSSISGGGSFDHAHAAWVAQAKSSVPIVWGMSVNAYRALILRKGPTVVLHPRTPSGGPSVLLSSIVLLASEIVISPTSSVEALLANCALVESLPHQQGCVGDALQEGVGHTLKCISQLIKTWSGYLTACSSTPKSSGGSFPQHSAPLFTSQFLAPSLSMMLFKMLSTRQCGDATPFWVGVVLVVVLLPLLVTAPSPHQHSAQRRRLSHDVATAVVHHLGRNWFFAVDHVRFVYELLEDRIHMCQARLVADFLVTATATMEVPRIHPFSFHSPISECAVCKQSLGCARQPRGLKSTSTNHSGEFIVQCVRCGHGGHLQHMLEWVASPLSRGLGCPAGCDCNCAY